MNENKLILNEIRILISEAKTEKAIKKLIAYLKNEEELFFEYEEAIKISGLYKKKVKDAIMGLEEGDFWLNKINASILKLLSKISDNTPGEESKVQSKISELTRRLLTSKNSFEIAKIKHELEILKRENEDNFQINYLIPKVEESYDWEIASEKRVNQLPPSAPIASNTGVEPISNSISIIPILIIILIGIIAALIYFFYFK